ncbi:MAG: hypothetical protein M3443_03390 [Actinomycetota bacterium]|nr:hypothetical protein [Actinomycetota bacterium]
MSAQSGLCGTGRADDRQPFARPDDEIDAVQHIMSLDVGVTHAAYFDPVIPRCPRGGLDIDRDETDALDLGESGTAALQLLHPLQYKIDGAASRHR